MRTNGFIGKIIVICLLFSVAIFVLSAVLFTQGPRVRFVQGVEDVQERSLTSNSLIRIVFDRPVEQRDYTEFLSIEPAIDFTAQTSPQNISITLDGNLQSDVEYKISLLPEVRDMSGRKMQSGFEHIFRSNQANFLYLERNYGVDVDSDVAGDIVDAADNIILSSLDGEPEVLFSHPEIRLFSSNSDFLVVAVRENGGDGLYTVDLRSGEIREELLSREGRINGLSLSPRGRTAVFTTSPEFSEVSVEEYQEFSDRLASIDLESGEIVEVLNEDGLPLQALNVSTDINGQIALIQDDEQTYFAVSPFNDFEPIQVGTYTGTFGFSQADSEIIFQQNGGIVRYNISDAEALPVDLDSAGFVFDISSKDEEVSFSSSIFSAGTSFSSVQRFSEWGDEPELVWRSGLDEELILRAFNSSYDNRHLALQLNPENCRFDDLGVGSQCRDALQRIIEPESGAVLDEFRGTGLEWLP